MDGPLTVSWPYFENGIQTGRKVERVDYPLACCDGCASRLAVTRRPRDDWTIQRLREAIREAFVVLKLVGYGPNGRPLELKAWWPEVVHDAAEAYGFNRAAAQRRATMEEISHLDRVLPWLYWIKAGQERKAVVGFALGMPSRIVAKQIGCSKDTARAREVQGLTAVLKRLRMSEEAKP